MNISKLYKKQKTRAQAMVEFALVIPVLLTLIYGLLETGRLLFIYASTITAARQAARYGSATGLTSDGVTYYYEDCTGIVTAANRVGFINTFDAVTVSYDGGFNTDGTLIHLGDSSPNTDTPTDPDCGEYTEANNGDRIVVKVTTQWHPIITTMPLTSFTITSQSERTIIASVDIYVAAPPAGWSGAGDGKPDLLSVTPSSTIFSSIGQVIQYTYNLRNTGVGTLTFPTVVDNKMVVDCSSATTVAPNATFTCYGSHTIQQADFDTGYFSNKAYPTGWPSDSITTVITAAPTPAMSLTKAGSPIATSRVGATITYTYTILNTGNVTLVAPFTISDDQIPVDCTAATDIAPGATATCIGTDQVTDQDIEAGTIVNQAMASVVFDTQTISSNLATFTVLTPSILLGVTPPVIVNAPGVGTYTYNLTNDTNYPATNVTLSDTRVTIDGSCPSVVPALSTVTCTGTYTFTQADIDAGLNIESTARITATMNTKIVSSNPVSVYVGIARRIELSTRTLVATPSASPLTETDTILYTYTLENSGNVTLKSPIVVTDTIGTPITCLDQSDFAPASTRTCTGTYDITAGDITTGFITTTGTASATFSDGTLPDPDIIPAAPISLTTPVYNGPRFDVSITANPTSVSTLGAPVEFTYTFTNTGSVDLSSYAVTSSLSPITFDCSLAKPIIIPGDFTSCKGMYNVAASGVTTNTITATAYDGAATINANNNPQSATVTTLVCSPSTVPLTFNSSNKKNQVWTIVNNSGSTINMSEIHLKWLDKKKLSTLTFAIPSAGTSTIIYTSVSGNNSGEETYYGSWTIASGATATVTAQFKDEATTSDFTIKFAESSCSGIWSNP